MSITDSQDRDWRTVAEEATKEQDPKRFNELIEELIRLTTPTKKTPSLTPPPQIVAA